MLRHFNITNFKAIKDCQALRLAPLTIIAGENNSGKSSALQALLLLAQSLRTARDIPALVLDGDLFQRGEASELVHVGESKLTLGVEYDTQAGEPTLFEQAGVLGNAEFSFQLAERQHLRLTRMSFGLTDSLHPLQSLSIEKPRRTVGIGEDKPAWLATEVLGFRPRDGKTGAWLAEGTELWNLLPSRFAERYDAKTEAFQEVLFYLQNRRRLGSRSLLQDQEFEQAALNIARNLLDDPSLNSLSSISPRQRLKLRAARSIKPPSSSADAFAALEGKRSWRRRNIPHWLETSLATLTSLVSSVRHVGPLRLPPQYIYAPLHHAEDFTVGPSGEFTAEQLYRHGRRKVDSIDPTSGEKESVSLEEAVDKWVRHFGIAQSVGTFYRSKVGHYFWVEPTQLVGYFDLTQVGVGASQLMPVLVQCLLSSRGSILLFEQPELHLHPRLQSSLGDFFLGMASTGRQCIVETHSEHIVNRVRLRIAEAEDDTAKPNVQMYFAERSDGVTSFRSVAINDFGAVVDWPEGFFDEAHLEAERILRSSIRKRVDERA